MNKYPKWIVLQLTNTCNLRCKMCYEWGDNGAYKNNKNNVFLEKSLIEKVVRECECVHPHYELFGGEPLLHPQFMDIISCIKNTGSYLEFPTNGILVRQYAKALVESQVDRIWISLDGPEAINDFQRGKGSYKKVTDGINELLYWNKKLGSLTPEIGVSCTITQSNVYSLVDHVEELTNRFGSITFNFEFQSYLYDYQIEDYKIWLYDHFDGKDVSVVSGLLKDEADFSAMDFHGLYMELQELKRICKDKNIKLYLHPAKAANDEELLHKYFSGKQIMASSGRFCSSIWLHCEINVHGEVTPCHTFYDMTFGNIKDSTLYDIWNGEKLKKYRRLVKSDRLIPICAACCRLLT